MKNNNPKQGGSTYNFIPNSEDDISFLLQAIQKAIVNFVDESALGYPSFSEDAAYPIGKVVFRDNKLWEFTTAHAAGAWNANEVTEFSIDIDSSMRVIAESLNHLAAEDVRKKAYIDRLEGMLTPLTGTAAPSVVPSFIGQEYIDTTNKKIYKAVGVSGQTSDWVVLN